MVLSLRKALPKAIRISPRVAGLAAVLPLVTATVVATPAKAEPPVVTCQATSFLPSVISGGNSPGGACTDPVQAGDSFEIDFSDVFTANGGELAVNKFYSLQIANLNKGSVNTLSFENVELFVTGEINSVAFPSQSIRIWTQTAPTSPGSYAQGLSDYSTSGTTGTFTFPPSVTPVNVASLATFKLTGPVSQTALGTAALINTIAIDLFASGITKFTGAKIRGTLGGSTSGAFSAGLASFSSNPAITFAAPDIIYGNAFNVPGPLPIVGAGAAFGWSRRLRKRVRKSSTASVV